jgi:uncharacterized protein
MITPKFIDCNRWTCYEEQISKVARKKKIKIKGIETFEEHNSLGEQSDSTIAANAAYFHDIVTEKTSKESIRMDYLKMLELYNSENINAIYKSSYNENPAESVKVLDFRNKIWFQRIKKISAEKSVLYAVGAAHLGGENGVINLLRKEGYTVKPVWD